MTTDLTKTFFDTFGIEPKYKTCIFKYCKNKKEYDCENCNDREWHYPQISDKQYLELICAYNNFQNDTASFFIPFDYKNIKNNLLAFLVEEINEKYKNRYFCNDVDKLKQQVQAIFEGER